VASSGLYDPSGIDLYLDRYLIIGDQSNWKIQQVDITTSTRTQIAGYQNTGTVSYSDGPALYDSGTGVGAKFRSPTGIAVDKGSQKIYIVDKSNARLRILDYPTATVSTWGTGSIGCQEGNSNDAKIAAAMEFLNWNENNKELLLALRDYHVIHALRFECPFGYGTKDIGCMKPICFGKLAGTPDVCNGAGTCIAPDTCSCTDPNNVLVGCGGRARIPLELTTITGGSTTGSTDGAPGTAKINNPKSFIKDWSSSYRYFFCDSNGLRAFRTDTLNIQTLYSFSYCTAIVQHPTTSSIIYAATKGAINKIDLVANTMILLAGDATATGTTDSFGTSARFSYPTNLFIDSQNPQEIYLIDNISSPKLRLFNMDYGKVFTITTFSGLGTVTSAYIDPYISTIAMTHNSHVVTVYNIWNSANVLSAGVSGSSGYVDAFRTSAKFNNPTALSIDYKVLTQIVASDSYIRSISYIDGMVTTIVGYGTAVARDGLVTSHAGVSGVALTYVDSTNDLLYVLDSSRIMAIDFRCPQGYTGSKCTTYSCYGKASTDPTVCNGRGTCTGPNTCTCTDAWNTSPTCAHRARVMRTVTTLPATVDGPWAGDWDASGNLIFTNSIHHVIQKLDLTTNIVTTIAGILDTSGGTDGAALSARFNSPKGIVCISSYCYIASDHTIRRLDLANNDVTTIAGQYGVSGNTIGFGTSAVLTSPQVIVKSPYSTSVVYFSMDVGSYSFINKLNVDSKYVSKLAGYTSGSSTVGEPLDTVSFSYIKDMTFDVLGNLLIVDSKHSVRRLKFLDRPQVVDIVAGSGVSGNTDNTDPLVAQLSSPSSVAVDTKTGYVYIGTPSTYKIRVYYPFVSDSYTGVGTAAGTGSSGSTDGYSTQTSFTQPTRMIYSNSRNSIFIFDSTSMIREATLDCQVGWKGTNCLTLDCSISNNNCTYPIGGECTSFRTCTCSSNWSGSNCQYTSCSGIPSNSASACNGHGNCTDIDTCVCETGWNRTNCDMHMCYGVEATNSLVCSGHGSCSSITHTCTCTDTTKWTGTKCDIPICYGVTSTNSATCSGHGTCYYADSCNCTTGWTGSHCDIPICSGLNATNSLVCSGHGDCLSYNVCNCTTTYSGSNCEYPVCNGVSASNSSYVCSGNGNCTSPSVCSCKTGYTDSWCQQTICSGVNSSQASICSGHGSCASPDVCVCSSDYIGSNCEYPICYGIPSNNTSVCSENGICLSPNSCNCSSGWSGNLCQVPICNGILGNSSSVCNTHGNCTYPDTCSCTTGYSSQFCDYAICGSILGNISSVCSGHGSCSSPDNCTCSAGYVGSTCEYVECYGKNSTDTNICSGRGNCSTPDVCTCSTGYVGTTCQYVECYGKNTSDSSICSGRGNCSTPDICTCNSGYIGSTCQYIECYGKNTTDSGICSGRGNCSTPDVCLCDSGYTGNNCELNICFGYNSSDTVNVCSGRGNCTDKDACECDNEHVGANCEYLLCAGFGSNNSSACHSRGNCTVYNFCTCSAGYAGSDCELFVCNFIRSNETSTCSGHGSCTAPNQCVCNSGWDGQNCEFPICNGVSANTTSVCNGYGNCTTPGFCNCTTEWTGSYCEIPICNTVPSNNVSVCSGNGSCVTDSTNNVCNCTSGYIGFNCQIPICFGIAGNSSSVCSYAGSCLYANHCLCNPGFYGFDCQNFDCYAYSSSNQSTCSGNGVCGSPDSCTCNSNWVGRACEFAVCNGLAGNDTSSCNGRGNCLTPNNCTCSTGWAGANCEYVICNDTLSTDLNVCNGHGVCYQPDSCNCTSNYSGNNCQYPLCNSITSNDMLVCSGHGVCSAPDNCSCTTGYSSQYCNYAICGSILGNISSVCSGHGSCSSPDNCTCSAGYVGSTCEYVECYGKNSTDTNICSGRGNCSTPDVCTCSTGYVGTTCQYVECYGKNSSDSSICSGRGNCSTPDHCTCNSGYTGNYCENIVCNNLSSNTSNVCSNHGSCYLPDACNCTAGYSGVDCQYPVCNTLSGNNTSVCSGHGICSSPNNCTCINGWVGTNCGSALCNNIPSNHSSVCNGHGDCNQPESCNCTLGYSGKYCNFVICNGVASNETSVCSGHGSCASPNSCNCSAGWIGTDCAIAVCYGVPSNDSSVCSSVGSCIGANQCSCPSGYSGTKCEQFSCFGVISSNHSVCSGNGNCSSPNSCVCNAGFYGGKCDSSQEIQCYGKNSTSPSVCNGNGACLASDICSCGVGYNGTNCEYPICNGILSSDSSVCNGHGICHQPNQCNCTNGYNGLYCSSLSCYSVAANDSTVCSSHGSCVTPNNCTCTSGWYGSNCDLTFCNNINSSDSNTCSGHGTCGSSNNCTCYSGWTGSDCNITICSGINGSNPNICSGHGSCIQPNQCSCSLNYTGNNCEYPYCSGIASNVITVCSGHGSCALPNSCNCSAGWIGSDCAVAVCYGVPSNDSSVCSSVGSCIGANQCSCPSGYSGTKCEQFSCFGVISSNHSVCSGNGNCSSPNSCVCNAGFYGGKCDSSQEIQCYGMNSTSPFVCNGNGACLVPDVCDCSSGYAGAKCEYPICNGIPSNSTNSCSRHGSCVSVDSCNCTVGYTGTFCEYPVCFSISNTSATVCSSHGKCLDADSCQCASGYIGSRCESSVCFSRNSTDPLACSQNGICTAPGNCQCVFGYIGQQCETSICFGIASNSSSVCSGHGICSAYDQCNCTAGTGGANCQIPTCYGLLASNPLVCGSGANGSCVATDNCTCLTATCTPITCFGKLTTDPSVCSGKGYCSNADTCTCTPHYSGPLCDLPVCNGLPANNTLVCNSRGNCSIPNNCTCETGYTGSDCESSIKNSLSANCSGNGVYNAGACNCSFGYTGVSCSESTCFGMNQTDAKACSGHGTCVSLNDCACFSGYSGLSCQYISCYSKVETDPLVCSGHGSCTSMNSCKCQTGYSGWNCSLSQCFGVNSTATNVCNGHGSCHTLDVCTCMNGYSGSKCEINSCHARLSTDARVCSGKGNCTALDTCACQTGYSGSACSVVDCHGVLSSDKQHICSGHGVCTAPDLCKCTTGYTGIDCKYPICSGRNSTNPKVCSGKGVCTSVNNCTCHSGYTGINCELNICNGILSTNKSACSGNGRCVSSETCQCYDGHYGVNCQYSFNTDIFCTKDRETVCSSHGQCSLDGNCTCTEGYSGTYCDIFGCFNVTDQTTCSGNGECTGLDECSCEYGYGGDTCSLMLFPCSSNDDCGNGTCEVAYGNCHCQSGYSGFNCSQWNCYKIPNYDPNVCSGNGHCQAPDTCSCFVTSSFSNCSIVAGGDHIGNGEEQSVDAMRKKSITKYTLLALIIVVSAILICCCLICLLLCILRLRKNRFKYQVGSDVISFEMYIPFTRSTKYRSVVPGYDNIHSESTSDLSDRSQSVDPLLFHDMLEQKRLTKQQSVVLVDLENNSWELVNEDTTEQQVPAQQMLAWDDAVDEPDDFEITYIEKEMEDCPEPNPFEEDTSPIVADVKLGVYDEQQEKGDTQAYEPEGTEDSTPVRAENDYIPTPVFELKQKVLDPRQTELIGLDSLQNIIPGQKYRFTLVTKDGDGDPRTSGGAKVSTHLKLQTKSDSSIAEPQVEIIDNKDGTYAVEFIVHQPGIYDMQVEVESEIIAIQSLLCPDKSSKPNISVNGLSALGEIVVDQEYEFSITSHAVKSDKLNVTCSRKLEVSSENSSVSTTVTQISKKEHQVNFVVHDAGIYDMKVCLDSEIVAVHTLHCKEKEPAIRQIEVTGMEQLNEVFTGEMYTFNITSKDQYGSPLAVDIEPHVTLVPVSQSSDPIVAKVVEQSDGTYTAEFTIEQAGPYQLKVEMNSDTVASQPIVCKARADPNCTQFDGLESLKEIIAGQKYQFTIISKDKFGNLCSSGGEPFSVKLQNNSGDSIIATVIDQQDGTYLVEFEVEQSGLYNLDVAHNSDIVYTLPVACTSLCDPSKTEIIGLEDIREVESGKKYQFTVINKDSNGKPCSIGPKLNVSFNPISDNCDDEIAIANVTDNNDGSYTAEFVLERKGPYEMNVSLDCNTVANPTILCNTVTDPSKTEVVGLDDLKEIIAGQKYEFNIIRKDKFGDKPSTTENNSFTVAMKNTMHPDVVVYGNIVDSGDGSVTVDFVVDKTGLYDLTVLLESDTIASQNIICKSESKEPDNSVTDPKHTEVQGLDLLAEIKAGQKCQLSIIAKDEYGTPRISGGDAFTVSLNEVREEQSADESEPVNVTANVTDLNDGTYSAEFMTESPGLYELTVSLSAEPIVSQQVTCTPNNTDPSRCVVSSDQNINKMKAGETRKLLINTFDKFGNRVEKGDTFKVTLTSKHGQVNVPEDQIRITELGDGTYEIEYTMKDASDYTLNIQHVSDDHTVSELSGFPCDINISEIGVTAAQNSVLHGEGLSRATINKTSEFTIITNDKFGNKRAEGGDEIKVSLFCLENNSEIKAEVEDLNNGKYSIRYTPSAPGQYKFEISINGELLQSEQCNNTIVTVNNEEVNYDASATVIQRAFRNWKDRQAAKAEIEENMLRNEAATTIQRAYREYLERKNSDLDQYQFGKEVAEESDDDDNYVIQSSDLTRTEQPGEMKMLFQSFAKRETNRVNRTVRALSLGKDTDLIARLGKKSPKRDMVAQQSDNVIRLKSSGVSSFSKIAQKAMFQNKALNAVKDQNANRRASFGTESKPQNMKHGFASAVMKAVGKDKESSMRRNFGTEARRQTWVNDPNGIDKEQSEAKPIVALPKYLDGLGFNMGYSIYKAKNKLLKKERKQQEKAYKEKKEGNSGAEENNSSSNALK
jgi:hypothetical protein